MRLILINGPCAVGKSTLAAQLHAHLTGSYLLNIDDLRRCISGYREDAAASAALSNTVAQNVTRTVLQSGTDLILDKLLTEPMYIDAFRQIGVECGAAVHELLLWAPKEIVMARAEARGWREGGLLSREKCERFWDEIDELRAHRPDALLLDTSGLCADEVYAQALILLGI